MKRLTLWGRCNMPRFSKLVLPLLLFFTVLPKPAFASEYNCSVEYFLTPSDDTDFISKNMRKKFLVTVEDTKVFVTSISTEFASSQTIFTIIGRDNLLKKVYGADLTPTRLETIVMGEQKFDGHYHATLVVQTDLFASIWKLVCE